MIHNIRVVIDTGVYASTLKKTHKNTHTLNFGIGPLCSQNAPIYSASPLFMNSAVSAPSSPPPTAAAP